MFKGVLNLGAVCNIHNTYRICDEGLQYYIMLSVLSRFARYTLPFVLQTCNIFRIIKLPNCSMFHCKNTALHFLEVLFN